MIYLIFYILFLDSEEKYQESIQDLINSIKEEKNLEVEKSQDELNCDLLNLKNQYINYKFRDEKEILIIEENFKYNIFNSFSNMFSNKNKK
jgi:hypothetical protein